MDASVYMTGDDMLDAVGLFQIKDGSKDRRTAAVNLKRKLEKKKKGMVFDNNKFVFREVKFMSKKQETRLISVPDARDFILFLDAADTSFIDIIDRYIGGDMSLVINTKSDMTKCASPRGGSAAVSPKQAAASVQSDEDDEEEDDESVKSAAVDVPKHHDDIYDEDKMVSYTTTSGRKMLLTRIAYDEFVDIEKITVIRTSESALRMLEEDENEARIERENRKELARRKLLGEEAEHTFLMEFKAKKMQRDEDDRKAQEAEDKKEATLTKKRSAYDAAIAEYISTQDETRASVLETTMKNFQREIAPAKKRVCIREAANARKKAIAARLKSAKGGPNVAIPATVLPPLAAPVETVDPDEGVYALTDIQGKKHYVGHSAQKAVRIAQHLRGDGAGCALGLTYVSPLLTRGAFGDFREQAETLERMLVYGIDNVRGGTFASESINRAEAFRHICGTHGLCYKCGSDGHFTDCCDGSRFAGWGHGFKTCGRCGVDGHLKKNCTAA